MLHSRHGGRETTETAAKADPGLRVAAVGLGGILDDGKDGRLHGLFYPWDKDTLGIAGALGDVPLGDLEQRFTTVVKVQPRLPPARTKLFTHVFRLLSHVLGESVGTTEPSEMPNSLLMAIILWYALPDLLH